MEEDNQKLMELQKNDDVDQDKDKMERESSTDLMREAENLMFTICLMPGTTLHIKIESEQRLPEGNWCISTLLIHNGQHYTSTVHNYTVNPELIRNLGRIHEPNAFNSNRMLPQMLMPLDLPRNPIITMVRVLGDANIQPMDITQMVDCFCNYMLNMARHIDNIFQPIFEETGDLPTLMNNTHRTQQSLQSMLRQFERTLEAYENDDNNNNNNTNTNHNNNCNDHAENDKDDVDKSNSQSDADADCSDDYNNDGDDDEDDNDDDNDDIDDSDSEIDIEKECLNARFVPVDGLDESQFKCDDDVSPTASEAGHLADDSLFLDADFDGFSHPDWSISSSDDANDITIEEDSWESDFEDNATFDAYMMRHLRAHASGLITRLNAEWVNATNNSVPPNDMDWDALSCNSMGEIDELWSELSCSVEELDAWQQSEDRNFETALSRPLRRLVGDIPPQTAQQERQGWQHFVDLCDLRPEPCRLRDNIYDDEPYPPLFSTGHWRPQENLATASNNIRSGNMYFGDSPPSGHCVHSFCFHHNVTDAFERDLARMRHNLYRLDSDLEPETEVDSELDKYAQKLNDETEITIEQEIVPLALYLKQTDDLIAQIRASL